MLSSGRRATFALAPLGLAVAISAFPYTTAFAAGGSWAVDADGNWSEASNWTPAAVPGTAGGDVVGLTLDISAPRTVTLDGTSRTVGSLLIGDPGSTYFNYTLDATGGAGLTFNNGGSAARLTQVNNTSASDSISVPLTLSDHLVISNRATLALSGGMSGSGKSVTKTGTGTLILSGASTYSGGTAVTGGGTLQLGATDSLPLTGGVVLGTNSFGNLNLGAFSQRLAGLTVVSTSSSVSNVVTVGSGQALTINGSTGVLIGIDVLANNTTKVVMTGGGALVVTNTSAYVTVGKHQANQSYNNNSTLDLSSLSSVTLGSSAVPVNEVRVAYGQTCTGTLTLSNTNNLLTATTVQVGNSISWNAGTGTLILGAGTNAVAANTVNIGVVKAAGSMKFNSQSPGSPGTVTIGGKTGGKTDFNIGCKFGLASGAVPTGTLDLRGHVASVNAGTVTIGKEDNSNGPTSVYTGGGTGYLYFDSGTFTADSLVMAYKSGFNAGSNAKATATLTVGGGEFTVNGGPIVLGFQRDAGVPNCANATLNVNGGTFRSHADMQTGPSNCLSTINLNGGTLDMTGHAIGLAGQTVTVFNASSGTLMNVGEYNAGAPLVKSGSGTLTLAGTNSFTGATVISAGTLSLGDGCLLGGGNYASDITNNAAMVLGSSANQKLSGVISGGGTLTKTGSGTLTLASVNTCSGATTVSGGVLTGVTGGSLDSSDVGVSSGATLGVRVRENDGQWSCKSLTLGSGTTTLAFYFYGVTPSASVAPLQINGDLVNGGTLNVSVSGLNVAVGTYPLVHYTGSLTVGSLGAVALPNGGVGSLVINAGNQTLDLSVTVAGTPLVWDGGSGDWDIDLTANWAGSQTYQEGDLVRFDDTSSGTAPFSVNVAEDVNPGGITVDNATKDYAFAGSGRVSGETSLTKGGAATLTLSGDNTYSGGTTLSENGGTLEAAISASSSAIGSGPVSIGSGATLVLNNGNTGASTVLKANSISGSGTLTLSFAAGTTGRSTALSGLNGFGGLVTLSSAGATGDKWDVGGVDAPAAAVQVAGGNTIYVSGPSASFASLAVSGTGNAENRGAVRMGAGSASLDAPITLQGDATFASDQESAVLSGNVVGTAGTGGTNVLTLGTAASAAGCTLSGAISDGSGGGRVALKQTRGVVTLSGANAYTGLTTVDGNGTLAVGADNTLPVSGALVLGGTSGVGNLTLAAHSQKLASVTAISTNMAGVDVVSVGDGQALIVDGSGGLFVGTDVGLSSFTQLKMAGGGSLVVTNTVANVTVGRSQSDEVGSNTCSLDLADLATVVLGSAAVPINEVRIAYGQYCPGSVKLSNGDNLITAKKLNIGNSNGYVPSGSGTMTLGSGANVLAADRINIGQSKGVGMLSFASQTPGSSGTVTIEGRAGGMCDISVGDKTGTWTAATPVGTLDLRGHVATVSAGTVTVGKEDHMAVKESGATGSLYFDSGTFTATNLVLGLNTGNNTGVWARATGTLTVSGGVFTVTASDSFTFAYQRGGGSASANLNILGGAFRTFSDILTGPSNCTSTINLNGGTLDLVGGAIGMGAQTVTVFSAKSGTLMNLGAFNNGAPLVKTGTGTLSLDGTNTYVNTTVVSNGVLRLTGGACLPPTAELYVENAVGATCNLDYAGKLFIHALYIDGVRMKGTRYSQDNLPAVFSGTGVLELPFQGTLIRVK